MNLLLESLVTKMTCRRKTKSERELVADITKTFLKYCKSQEYCKECKYTHSSSCIMGYLADLVNKYNKGE